jgi:hypothetical protein
MPQNKIRILIVSVGSLVGQNILDALEFSEFNRRHLVHITGTNSLALSANNFRCDECYLVPPTASDEYAGEMREIIRKVEPDLILSARDADTVALKKLKMEDGTLPGELPYGSLESVNFALDKWESFHFCKKHQLPFAETFVRTNNSGLDNLKMFIEKAGYPLIAKPIKGFASKGVLFIRNWDEALQFFEQEEYILQEYLGKAEDIESYLTSLDGPKPLFTETPNISHHTCHIPISPGGKIGEIFVLRNHHNFGAVMKLQRVDHPELVKLATRFAEAFILEGGYGPLSVQFRLDKHGNQKAQEMNLRTTGSTYPRLMMGQDEIGTIVNWMLPAVDFPMYKRPKLGYDTVILKSLYSYQLFEDNLRGLEKEKYWRSDKN